MPHYVPNEYSNIFGCHIFTERISEVALISYFGYNLTKFRKFYVTCYACLCAKFSINQSNITNGKSYSQTGVAMTNS